MRRKRVREVPAEYREMREAMDTAASARAFMKLRESIGMLELQAEDAEWKRLLSTSEREFSPDGLRRIMRLCRVMFLKNPLINRSVSVQALYVWAQGCTVTAPDDATQEIVDAFLEHPKNKAELTGHQARTMKECDLATLGNVFLVLFASTAGDEVVVRSLPPEEIDEVITNPEDAKEPWAYKRTWSVVDLSGRPVTQAKYYPAINIDAEALAALQAAYGDAVMPDPVYHMKVGGLSDMRMGLPEVYQAVDWARAYKGFLEDWASINRALAKFAWQYKTPGGAKAVDAAQRRLSTTLGPGHETNPAPVSASTFVASGGDMSPMKTAGATTSAEEGRRLLLMVAAGMGLPETFYGDVSTGNLATASSLDRPTELKFIDRQALWAEAYQVILGWVIQRRRSSAVTDIAAKAPPRITVTFPPILEHDVQKKIGAIISAATLDGKTRAGTVPLEDVARMVLTALGVDDVEEILVRVLAEEDEKQERAAEMAAAIAGGQGGEADSGDDEGGAGNGNRPPGNGRRGEAGQVEALRESARELRNAIKAFAGRKAV